MLRRNDFPHEAVEGWEEVTLYKPVGCSRCNGTGYKGRLGIYEVMVVTEAIERLTVERKSADEIRRVAQAEGMRSLREDGIDKVLAGSNQHRGDRSRHRVGRGGSRTAIGEAGNV